MAQFADAKRRYPDALLFFRMGDFYELFFEDARTAADALGLTLTSRDKERKIPMAGVPVRSADGYLRRLLQQGRKVAICEQVTEPGPGKKLLEREVVRVLTPGTLTEEEALDPRASNFLLAIRPASARDRRRRAGLAWVDLSTGRFLVAEVADDALADEVARVGPAEILLPEGEMGVQVAERLSEVTPAAVTFVPPWTLESEGATAALKRHFRVASLAGFGLDRHPLCVAAAGGALEYLGATQMTTLGHVTRIERFDPGGTLVLEKATRRRLDLVERADGGRHDTLLSVLDRTRTAMGGRALREWILAPLTDPAAIARRLDGVEELGKDAFLRRDLREALGGVKDVERILARVATQRGNARDLVALASSLEALPRTRAPLEGAYSRTLSDFRDRIETFDDLATLLSHALVDEPPPTLGEGGMVREGHDPELDELRHLSRHGKEWIAAYQAKEAERTGIPKLKVGYNKVFGYYLEVTNAHRDRVPPEYVRKQTIVNAERYVTQELREHEEKVLRAEDRAKERERQIFQSLRDRVAERIPALQTAASVLAELDALASLAEVATTEGYVRPEIEEGIVLEIRDGRHPVVERALTGSDRFVANDTVLDATSRIGLVTGPNMAGKSTYIRQTALIVLMAQMGSFVPASRARVGIADRLFARVGAEDDLARGQSTFMVEMSEAAYILHHATERSVVILDEVGRGTSTFDGIAIAWALTEYLSEVVGCRTLFATHYAELTQISEELPAVRNWNVAVREWNDGIVFLRRIQEGASDRSYGIHVARLAGVPDAVVERARAILGSLESRRADQTARVAFGEGPPRPRDVQLGLFAPPPPHPALERLRQTDPDTLTPLEALTLLAELRRLARE
jgi:DNA mismatch repair protein MutS